MSPLSNVTCEHCACEFYKSPSEQRATKHNYCSRSCFAQVNNKLRKLSGHTVFGRTKTVNCFVCGAITTVALTAKAHCLQCRADSKKNTRYLFKLAQRVKVGPANQCVSCPELTGTKFGKYCPVHLRERQSDVGRKSAESQRLSRRSRNEICFSELCKKHFSLVLENERMFNGWDADVILPDLKVAVLWNGNWHRKKLAAKHSVAQVQNRDKIKTKEITAVGYQVYVIEDHGKHDTSFVQTKFVEFIRYLDAQSNGP